jgi:hypothetical protein
MASPGLPRFAARLSCRPNQKHVAAAKLSASRRYRLFDLASQRGRHKRNVRPPYSRSPSCATYTIVNIRWKRTQRDFSGNLLEDCGGFPGYYDFLDNIASKQSKKRKAALDWYGSPYDPDDIDEQQITINLKRIANAGRPGRSKSVKR